MGLDHDPSGQDAVVDPAKLDAFLERAVERQIAEQRALREALEELTATVRSLAEAPAASTEPSPGPDLDDLADRMRAAARLAVDPLIDEIRVGTESVIDVVKRQEPPRPPDTSVELAQLRGALDELSNDVDGIARALIDMNSGLRGWAEGIEGSIADIATAMERSQEAARQAMPPPSEDTGPEDTADRLEIQPYEDVRLTVQPPPPPPPSPLAEEVAARIKESIELTLYLADQIDEFDRVLQHIGDLPQRLEGVFSQGVRRTLAARTKLDAQAAEAMDEALASLDSYMERIDRTTTALDGSARSIEQLGLGQVELSARVDALAAAISDLAAGRQVRASSLKPARKRASGTKGRSGKSGSKAGRRTAKARKPARRPSSDRPAEPDTD